MNRNPGRLRARWWVASGSTLLFASALVGLVAHQSAADEPSLPHSAVLDRLAAGTDDLTGEQLGQELGLQPVKGDPTGCWAFAEYDDPWGYCMDDVVKGDRLAAYVIGRRINGSIPTDAESNYMAALIALNDFFDQGGTDPETLVRLQSQVEEARAGLPG